ncbi:hypothetical protein HanPI659440_Chr13g0493931 [Helianthus annuus]|nr:hypothetical protein HanPI659440_Chr13g0493931 [Helianthus annuus]
MFPGAFHYILDNGSQRGGLGFGHPHGDGIGTVSVPVPKILVPNLNKNGYQIPYQIYWYGYFGTVPALVPLCLYFILFFEHLYGY